MSPRGDHRLRRAALGRARFGRVRLGLVALATAVAAACSSPPNTDMRQWTDDLTFRISSDPMPPKARERITYKVVVHDKASGQPIDKGEGRIFATSRDGANTWDSFEPGPEPGTYYANMKFITAGDWAVAIQFRRDSTQKLERVDWRQQVFAARQGS